MTSPSGSPPRAWGLGIRMRLQWHQCRFTPTGVGTGRLRLRLLWTMAVHPHGRGDWLHRLLEVGACRGSPPRAWGLALIAWHAPQITRFTPTGVGTGTLPGSCRLRSTVHPTGVGTGSRACTGTGRGTVHPHGRGDWSAVCPLTSRSAGSPPRAWGLVGVRSSPGILWRFTPTGVGTGQTL